ncbi:MAG: DNA replication and repair protein RecF [Akkermansiaceae bacterium]|nr:DNA replication and repair protein RecF [Akkermansiaceae bacterium]
MLTSLRLQDFRCFESLDIEAPEQGAILIGDNAQGKTSILEAICMLMRLHSPRTHRMGSLARFGTKGFGIAGNPWKSERRVRYSREGLKLKVEQEERHKKSDYLHDGGRIVWLGNEDLELIRGPGEGRRRYLDFIGSQLDADYLHSWSRYRRALQAKNLLLKEKDPRDSQIHAYEEILIEHGSLLMKVRARAIKELSPLAATAQNTVSGKEEPLKLEYLPASGEDLRESMHQARERERRTRQSVVGPHRDDLALRIHDMPANEFASEGQQRTLALALKLAQGQLLADHHGAQPIYLLDDIFGELDVSRRNALMSHLPEPAQKWITTTHLDWMGDTHGLDALARVTVENGECRA